jgi:energy-coupling factor transporter ATP-binding protein EcfA2
LSLVLAIVLTAGPRVVALDEPTRGLDYAAKAQLAAIVGDLAAAGHAVLVATHDVEFVAQVADEVVVLAAGEVVSAGPTVEVLAESPAFAPQMSKILGNGWLTVAQVEEALA